MNSVVNWSDRFEEHLQDRVTAYGGSPLIAKMLRYHFGYGDYGPARRGKRLRPTMLSRACEAAGGHVGEAALDAAAAVELLHNYSLVHDDIEDGDELRHGRRTLWSVFGVAQAINAGDAMCAISFLTLARAQGLEPEVVLAMLQRLHAAHLTMCEGQSLDLQFEREAFVDVEAYRRMISYKTAALFEASCALGALCAGGGESMADAYAGLGLAYGMAFQVRDDLLGIWATQGQTGKVSGGDLARRKWTYPIVWALSRPPSTARATVERAYAAGTPLDQETVSEVIAALDELGAREAAMRAIAEPMAVMERHPSNALRDYLLGTLAEAVG
jgi:geranylgeranyl diphosphate synthase, type I